MANEDVRHKHSVAIGQYFYHNQRRNRVYGARFVICEVINVVNLVTQIFLIDSLLGGEFSTYGFKVKVYGGVSKHYFLYKHFQVLNFALLDDEERNDPMVKIFPKVTKCTFHNFGVSGSIQQ